MEPPVAAPELQPLEGSPHNSRDVGTVTYIGVRNWVRFQHYNDERNIVWVKLYTSLLDDDDLHELPVETQLLWDRLLLLAARKRNAIRNDPEAILKATGLETRISPEGCHEAIQALLKGRWLRETKTNRRASKPASHPASHPASSRREEKEVSPQTPLTNGHVYICDRCPGGMTFKSQARLDEHLYVVHEQERP
jgi:hypothetical protein